MFSKYYQSELAYLREMGRAFGLANPAVAGLLAERGADPDVERLLEGFAFLTARIRERLDQAVPEVVHGLTELLLPHLLRPLPAATVVEFTPHARALRGRVRVPAGAELASVPVDGTACRFRTTAPVDLLPLSVAESTLDQAVQLSPVLRVALQTSEQGRTEVLQPDGVRLFLHGDYPVASGVLLWLLRHLKAVVVRDLSGSGRSVRLPPDSVRAPAFGPEGALLPWPARAPAGLRMLQEYFTLPQAFLFVDVTGLHAALPAVGERFELAFELERPPPLPARLPRDLFRLHCAPAVNLFATSADPLVTRLPGEEHLLRAAELDPRHAEVYSVDGVQGVREGRGERAVYGPYVDFAHAQGPGAPPAFWRLRRTLSPLDDGFDTYLSLELPQGVQPAAGPETLSVDLTCTNRSLAARLQLGDVSVPTAASPTVARFRNVVPVSKPARPPLGSELHWRLLSHLALQQRSLTDPGALRALLGLYNFQVGVDHPAARANQLRVEAIGQVSAAPARRALGGVPVRGARTLVELEESRFAGPGDAFLFGAVIDELLAASVTLNSFNELAVRLQPSNMEYTWPARNGSQPLL